MTDKSTDVDDDDDDEPCQNYARIARRPLDRRRRGFDDQGKCTRDDNCSRMCRVSRVVCRAQRHRRRDSGGVPNTLQSLARTHKLANTAVRRSFECAVVGRTHII